MIRDMFQRVGREFVIAHEERLVKVVGFWVGLMG
jgi:hypothetical protein